MPGQEAGNAANDATVHQLAHPGPAFSSNPRPVSPEQEDTLSGHNNPTRSALAYALKAASDAGQWDVVKAIAEALARG